MKLYLFLAIALVWSAVSCHRVKLCGDMPTCLKEAVKDQLRCDDYHIDTYLIQGKKVYVYDAGTCVNDGFAYVYDENCELICTLGGFAGIDTCMGVNFFMEAEFLERCP